MSALALISAFLFVVIVGNGSTGSVVDQVVMPLYIIPILASFLAYAVKATKDLKQDANILDQCVSYYEDDDHRVGEDENDWEARKEFFHLPIDESEIFSVEMTQITLEDDGEEKTPLKSGSEKEIERFFAGLRDYQEALEAKKLIPGVVDEASKKIIAAPYRQTSRGLKRRRVNKGL